MKNRTFLCCFAVTAISVLVSCAGRSAMRLEKLADVTLTGNYQSAIESIRKNPNLYGKNSQLLYNLDIGVLFHYAHMYDSSNLYLQRAADIYNELFTRSVTNEAAAILVNDNVRPYRGMPFELTMMHQLITFNYLAKGDVDEALVEVRRAQLLFDELERKDRKDTKYSSDGMFHYVASIAYDAVGESDNSMISLYKSIKAFQNGPVPLPRPIGEFAYRMFILNDRPDDNVQLGLKGGEDTEGAENFTNNSSEIVFIGYAGRGPSLDEKVWRGTYVKDGLLVVNHVGPNGVVETISRPAPYIADSEIKKASKGKTTSSGTTFHIKFALPTLKKTPSRTAGFSVRCSGISQTFSSIVINDLEKQAQKYLDDTKAATLSRTVVRVVLRTIAAQKAKAEIQTGNALANLFLNVGTDVLTDQMERADTRSCFLLPRTVQIARIPVKPGTYSLDVSTHDKSGNIIGTRKFVDVEVKARRKTFVFYSSFK